MASPTKHALEQLRELLHNPNVRVITPENLTEILDGKYGRVRTPSGASSKLSTDRAPAS
jgi:hypothetical protein